jgi:hypothetical protein
MSNIDTQIKQLLLKKKKIDYISYVADLIKNDTKCHDFKDVQKEIVSKIEPFLLELMSSIETDSEVKSKVKEEDLSPDEIKVLKAAANKAMTKAAQPDQPPVSPEVKEQKKQQAGLSTADKMNFAMNNRHLANKRVQVINDKNVEIFGQVVGLDAPFVVVRTDTGPVIQVPLEKVVPS